MTLAESAVERVIEEHAGGDAAKAQALRELLRDQIGAGIQLDAEQLAVQPPAGSLFKFEVSVRGLPSTLLKHGI